MEPNQLINDDLLSSEALAHHGTKGMKWGIWNAETRAKYLGGLGRKLSSGVKKRAESAKTTVSAFANKKVSDLKASHEAKKTAKAEQREAEKANRKEAERQRKELGMSAVKYNQLRETTLASHDPAVIAKGMHTLTDAELDKKLDRLKKEDQVSKIATDRATRKHQEHKARSEAIQANPVYKIGARAAGNALKSMSKGLVDINKGNNNKGGDNSGDNKNKGEDNANQTTTSSEKKSFKLTKKTKPSVSDDVYQSRVRKVVKESAAYNATPSSAKSAATRGQRLLSDDKIRAEIIDVTPVEASSYRSNTRKALPSGRE